MTAHKDYADHLLDQHLGGEEKDFELPKKRISYTKLIPFSKQTDKSKIKAQVHNIKKYYEKHKDHDTRVILGIAKDNLIDELNHFNHDHVADSMMYSMMASKEQQRQWKQQDALWTKITYGVGIFILGYGVYHFIRFLMM